MISHFRSGSLPSHEGRECSGVLHVSVFEGLSVLVPSGLEVLSDTDVELRVRSLDSSFVHYVVPNAVPL